MDHIIDAKSSEQDVIDNSERFLSRFRKELNNKRECNVQKLSICDYTGDLERTENGIRIFSQGSSDNFSQWSHLMNIWSLFSIKDRKYVSRDAQQHLQAISKIIEKHLTGKSGNSGLVNATLKASYVLASVMRPYMDKYIQGIHFQIFWNLYIFSFLGFISIGATFLSLRLHCGFSASRMLYRNAFIPS